MKKNNKKGFTLAELLIVVAIIAVLTAIAIPVFSGSLVKSKEAADMANVRAAYADAVTAMLTSNAAFPSAYDSAKFGKLNFGTGNGSKLTWTATSAKLTVAYAATKVDPLSLTADALK